MNRPDIAIKIMMVLLIAVSPVCAATLTGTAYTENLQVAKFALLTINTTPEQRIILDDGSYNLEVPRGSYILKVIYNDASGRKEDTREVMIIDDGTCSYDFILFPADKTDEELPSFEDISIPEEGSNGFKTILSAIIVLAVLFITTMIWMRIQKGDKRIEKRTDEIESSNSPSESLQQVIDIIKKEGGRTTQRDLRRQLPYSEAKISMMLTELEHKKRIERIKKGRGNLIVLK